MSYEYALSSFAVQSLLLSRYLFSKSCINELETDHRWVEYHHLHDFDEFELDVGLFCFSKDRVRSSHVLITYF